MSDKLKNTWSTYKVPKSDLYVGTSGKQYNTKTAKRDTSSYNKNWVKSDLYVSIYTGKQSSSSPKKK